MPAFYTKYQANLERFLGEFAHVQTDNAIQVAAADLPLAPTTLGGRVLAQLPGINFENLFDVFNAMTNAFIWDPSARGSYTVARVLETLDGTRTSGECKVLAAALLGLWVFPQPFGLGQSRTAPSASLYTFENYDALEGFISYHPLHGVRGLRPNIMHPHGTAADVNTRQPLYQWGNHKCVFYHGRLWDPSYLRVWNREDEMVAFEFTGQRHATDHDAYQVRVVTSHQAKGWLANQLMFMRLDLRGGGWKGPYRAIG